MERLEAVGLELQPFERGRQTLLAAPLNVAPGLHVVLELFDKKGAQGVEPFGEADRRLAAAAADFGAEMLRQAVAERQTQRVLFDAVAAALEASASVTASLREAPTARPEDPPPQSVMQRLREGLSDSDAALAPEETVRLAEAIRVLALRHGSAAVRHCTQLVESLRRLLDEASGAGGEAP